jgi:signal transduction histidine kinase
MQHLAVAYRDSLQAADVRNRLSLFDFEMTQKELEELRAKNALVEVEKDFQEVVIIAISITALLAMILAYLFYRSRRIKEVANRLLELKTEQIEEQAGELEDLNTFKTKLIAIISHDLKSPIQGLFSIIDILSRKLVRPDELLEALPSLRTSLKHCNNKINDLLKWSGGTMDDQFVRKEVVELAGVVSSTVLDLCEESQQKELTIHEENLQGYFIWADQNIIQTVLRNLLHNAVKFSRRGGIVAIRAERHSGEVVISIADEGTGMSVDQLSNLFKVRKDVGKGTVGEVGSGIGLIICKDLLEMMACRLWAESTEGAGSTFFVACPSIEPAMVQTPAAELI